ncbi:hypothetical protein LXL04_018389 [Taraxacum kok-saghyz]
MNRRFTRIYHTIAATCQIVRHVLVSSSHVSNACSLIPLHPRTLLIYCTRYVYRSMQAMKETAANIAASALSGMEKTKAVLEEKVEKISTSDPIEKDMATLKKEDRIRLAEIRKREAYTQNAAAATGGPNSPTFTAAGQVQPEKNPFQKTTSDVKNTAKPAVQQGRGATVEKATPVVQSTNAMSV